MTIARPVRVYLLDDNEDFLELMHHVVERDGAVTVVGRATDAHTALRDLATLPEVDVVVVDVELGAGLPSGLDFLEMATAAPIPAAFLIVTTFLDPVAVRRGLAAGACGHVVKSDSTTDLIPAILSAAQGFTVLGAYARSTLITTSTAPMTPSERSAWCRRRWPALTSRQIDVALLAAQGLTNVTIAQHLALSSATVRNHLSAAMSVVGVSNRTALAAQLFPQ